MSIIETADGAVCLLLSGAYLLPAGELVMQAVLCVRSNYDGGFIECEANYCICFVNIDSGFSIGNISAFNSIEIPITDYCSK